MEKKTMNWKKFTLGITVVNLLSWGLIELWSSRYADSNVAGGAAFLIGFHLLGYYLITLMAYAPEPKEKILDKYSPANCPGHDWQTSKHSSVHFPTQTCVKCGAERGKSN